MESLEHATPNSESKNTRGENSEQGGEAAGRQAPQQPTCENGICQVQWKPVRPAA